jgi:hypothetical protein
MEFNERAPLMSSLILVLGKEGGDESIDAISKILDVLAEKGDPGNTGAFVPVVMFGLVNGIAKMALEASKDDSERALVVTYLSMLLSEALVDAVHVTDGANDGPLSDSGLADMLAGLGVSLPIEKPTKKKRWWRR